MRTLEPYKTQNTTRKNDKIKNKRRILNRSYYGGKIISYRRNLISRLPTDCVFYLTRYGKARPYFARTNQEAWRVILA